MVEKISMSSLGIIWQVLFKGYQELQYGSHLFQHGEMLIIRLVYLYDGPSPDDLVKKIEKEIAINQLQNLLCKKILRLKISNTINKLDVHTNGSRN